MKLLFTKFFEINILQIFLIFLLKQIESTTEQLVLLQTKDTIQSSIQNRKIAEQFKYQKTEVWTSIPVSLQILAFTDLKKLQANANQQICHKLSS